jgi:hypothetical protein
LAFAFATATAFFWLRIDGIFEVGVITSLQLLNLITPMLGRWAVKFFPTRKDLPCCPAKNQPYVSRNLTATSKLKVRDVNFFVLLSCQKKR